jgi:tetratricopeptide (TPR) repeat protein
MKDRRVARKKSKNPTAETLRELEESGDRIAEWASENAALILGAIAAILVIAAGAGLYIQAGAKSRDAAADDLAMATSQYRRAMGADPIGGAIPEPANQELAERTRSQYVERFSEVANEHGGTSAGALAWLEAGQLQTQLGRLEAAAESFGHARDEAAGSSIAALGSIRLANLAENRGDPATAAESYEAAAAIDAYPLRAGALADAARCWVEAEDDARALAAFQRLESEFPDEFVEPAMAALIAELRFSQ